MAYTYSIEIDQSLVRIELTGKFDMDKFREFFTRLLHADEYKPGFHVLCDARKLDFTRMSSYDISELVQLDKSVAVLRGNGKTAFVVRDDLQFGLSRMVEIQHDRDAGNTMVIFRDMEKALSWLEKNASSRDASAGS